ncbi:MAG TPA: MarR family winged helix-turn-helix transcriptional regulator [Mycobacteriales bacterium]|nr:MarR family winged helix-turn-helix transcriptional regulator [Mycobacteriales bacterium]
MPPPRLSDEDYQRLLAFRHQLRQFDKWSSDQAAAHGLTQTQHQLLLAIRGHDDARGPTIGQLAGYLMVRHHTAVELADRTEKLGLVCRQGDGDDHRVVRLVLTPAGAARLAELTALHLEELRRLAPTIGALVSGLS